MSHDFIDTEVRAAQYKTLRKTKEIYDCDFMTTI